jgi:hypothetical protein
LIQSPFSTPNSSRRTGGQLKGLRFALEQVVAQADGTTGSY